MLQEDQGTGARRRGISQDWEIPFTEEIIEHVENPGGAAGKESACQCRRHKRHGFDPWVRKIPWRGAWHPTPVFLPGESHGQRNLVGCSPRGRKRDRHD